MPKRGLSSASGTRWFHLPLNVTFDAPTHVWERLRDGLRDARTPYARAPRRSGTNRRTYQIEWQ